MTYSLKYIFISFSEKGSNDALNTCFFYFEIFRFDQYDEETGIEMNDASPTSNWKLGQELMVNMTIDQLIHFTPGTDEMINGCKLRNVSKEKLSEFLPKEKCLEHIKISKYVYSFLVCYRFVFSSALGTTDPMIVTSDTDSPFTMKLIAMNSTSLKRVNIFLPFFNERHSLPIREMGVSTLASRGTSSITAKPTSNPG